ncbi:Patatin-like phospholipase domain [Fusarium oxysporum f. sp. vasinfectum]|nr:Patatin-like phospholipase domain [Fusarium oxysporum f. sp. vasinfectum]
MAGNKVVTDNRWMTISEQYDNLSIQLTPLLAERLDVMQATAGMALLVGLPSSTELAQHLGTTSSAGDVLLDADPRAKVLRIACPTLPRRVSAEGHCHGDNIEWARGSGLKHSESLAAIYSRLLGPFSHVVCVFVSSFSSTLELGSFLSSWLRSTWSRTQMFAPSHSPAALPRLIVLTEGKTLPGGGFLGGLKSSLEAIVMEQTGFSLTRAFSNFTVKEALTEVGLLRQRRYTKMTAFLESECAAARRDFERLNMLYDAHNLVDLFSRAYRCLVSNTIFNPVIASRAWNPIPSNAVRQIVRFLSDYEDKESLQKFALPYLVSAIRANAYPATSHPFDFPLIFDTIYKSTWDHAAHTASLTEDMCLLFERMVRRSLDAVAVIDTEDTTNPMENLKSLNGLNAANLLDAVTTVGPNPDDCVTQARTEKVTAGQLNEDHAVQMDIQTRLRDFLPGMDIIEMFDVCAGTSTGGICALSLAHKGISIKEAIQEFTDLSQRVFVTQPIWTRVLNLLARGSIYGSRAIDEPLKSHYGESTLSDYSLASARAAKILVTVTGTPSGDHILSNFNGVGLDASHCDFEQAFCQLSDPERQKAILAWQAARCTSSAPGTFPPFTINGVGTFQDGAMWRNNPMGVGLSLLPSLSSGHLLPDIALSIGTGCKKRLRTRHPGSSTVALPTSNHLECPTPQLPLWRKFPLIDLAYRLGTSFCESIAMDGEKFYSHLVSEVLRSEVADRCRRLNVEFPMGCPSLDDSASLPFLVESAIEQYQSDCTMQEVLYRLLSSLFHFEIFSRPIRRRTHVSFCGRIFCNIQPGDRLHHFIKVLRECKAEFLVNGRFIALDNIGDWGASEFELPIRGTVTDMQTQLDIFLCWNVAGKQTKERISRSPFSLDELMEAQGWDTPQSRALRPQVGRRHKRRLNCHATWTRIKKARQ